MKKIALSLASLSAMALPLVAGAQIGGNPPNISTDLVSIGNQIARGAWIVFTIIAVLAFIIAGVLFLVSGGDPDKITKARQAFLWGVAGVVVGILAFTIITVVSSVIH